jgi:hypothetical protein
MKKIAIISTDTLPLPLKLNINDNFIYNNQNFSLKDKCSRATGLGVRAWKIGEQLVKYFDTTIFIPSINYPGDNNIDYSKSPLNIKFNSYSYEDNLLTFDNKLYKELLNFDVIILVQAPSALCYNVCSQLPKGKIFILDGWVPAILELSEGLLGYPKEDQLKTLNNFIPSYLDLIKRSNCILYNADRHYFYYEGILASNIVSNIINKTKLIKLRFGIDENKKVLKPKNDKLKLLWYGPIYPWYNPERLIEVISKYPNEIELHFKAVKHPRYTGSYTRVFKDIFSNIPNNILVNEEYNDNHANLYNYYDAGIVFAKDTTQERFALRARVFDMLSYGFPVITNENNAIFDEINLKDSIYPINSFNLEEQLLLYAEFKETIIVSDESFKIIKDNFLWKNSIIDLVNYLQNL